MAFIKIEKKDSGTYLRLVESYRDKDGKSKHRTVATLGKAEDFSKKTPSKNRTSIFKALRRELP